MRHTTRTNIYNLPLGHRAEYREIHAVRRAFPWRFLLETIGAILAIGGGIVAVSTPAAGGICFGLGLLALLGAGAE